MIPIIYILKIPLRNFTTNIKQLFNSFYTTERQGTVLGLAFCKKVMTEIGGDIVCHSIESEFTDFCYLFPVQKNAASPISSVE